MDIGRQLLPLINAVCSTIPAINTGRTSDKVYHTL